MNENIEQKLQSNPGGVDPILRADMQSIPSKLSFKISEVAKLLSVKTHVLRYWEMEFEPLKPKKMPNGQRLYFRKDLEVAVLIKKLLYRDGFSVKGAKKVLSKLKKENTFHNKQALHQEKILKSLHSIQNTISNIRELIK